MALNPQDLTQFNVLSPMKEMSSFLKGYINKPSKQDSLDIPEKWCA